MSDTNRLSIASMSALSISGSVYVLPCSPDDIPAGFRSTPDKVIVSKPKSGMLTMVFVTTTDGETKEIYATVPLPDTYEAAVALAIEALGTHMSDPTPSNISLCSSTKNRKDEWVWADIQPKSWKMTLELNHTEIGVFEKRKKFQSPESLFINGAVLITTGKKNKDGTKIEWTDVTMGQQMYPLVARPKTFSEAVDILNMYFQTKPKYSAAHDPRLGDKNLIRFYTFPEGTLRVWQAIPLAAHSDDDIWRALVPDPGTILGAMVD